LLNQPGFVFYRFQITLTSGLPKGRERADSVEAIELLPALFRFRRRHQQQVVVHADFGSQELHVPIGIVLLELTHEVARLEVGRCVVRVGFDQQKYQYAEEGQCNGCQGRPFVMIRNLHGGIPP
jgi:hypothetical protein